MKKALIFLLIFTFLNVPLAVKAKTIRVDNAVDFKAGVKNLEPGDILIVESGEYKMDYLEIKNIAGTLNSPITIKAEGKVIISGASYSANVVEIKEVHYLNFEGFEITSEADPYANIDGVKISGEYSSYINFNNLKIHDVSGNGISVFAKEAHHINLRNSEVSYTMGSGLYWGYPGANIVHDVIIENNYIHNAPKEVSQVDHYGIQLKGWSYGAQILNNTLNDVGGTTRSGIIVYYGKTPGKGDVDANKNIVKGNVLWNVRNEGITVMSDALIEDNVVIGADYGINIQTYSDESFGGNNYVENLNVKNNTVFSCGTTCFNISGWDYVGANVSFSGNKAYQDYSGKNAITGSVGKAVCQDNVYYGVSSLNSGVKKSEKVLEVARAVALIKNAPGRSASELRSVFLNALGVENDEPVVIVDIDSVSDSEVSIIYRQSEFPILDNASRLAYNRVVYSAGSNISERAKNQLAQFIKEGTATTRLLGSGERAGVVNSFASAFGKMPEEKADWQDVIKIANGRWPSQRSSSAENRAQTVFKKIYLRSANMNQPNDNAAITIITYGLRTARRNMNSEKVAIKTFEHIYKKSPSSASDWDAVRAIAYSGAKR